MKHVCLITWCLVLTAFRVDAQTTGRVNFETDIQPVLRSACYGCHGPAQQSSGLRLDRRRDALRGGSISDIAPGAAEASRLYLRISGETFGPRMPPTGKLPDSQIALFKAWIDQGAAWPDRISGEAAVAAPDPNATKIIDALRAGQRAVWEKLVSARPDAARSRGPGGSTPLMYAALYGTADTVKYFLAHGADVSTANDVGATALMWATADASKVKVLLDAGADANARSQDHLTPLIIAAGRRGSMETVRLLLDHHADPSAKSTIWNRSALQQAAYVADAQVMRLLIDRGADVKAANLAATINSLNYRCAECLALLQHETDPARLGEIAVNLAPPNADGRAVKTLVDQGADVRARFDRGDELLAMTAASDLVPVDAVHALLDRGASANAKDFRGKSALELARMQGATGVVGLLLKSAATAPPDVQPASAKPVPAGSVRAAVERSLPLLQRADSTFLRKSGCVSCHNNALSSMALAEARRNGFRSDDQESRAHLKTIAWYLESWRERAVQGIGIPGEADTVSYILSGLADDRYPGDAATDAMAYYLKGLQLADGRWSIEAHRPPIESTDITVTATCVRALKTFMPSTRRPEYMSAVNAGGKWLAGAATRTNEEAAMKLLGLTWSGAEMGVRRTAARALILSQRDDGGWAQLPSLASDAYATGQALVALEASGVMKVTDPVYQRGVRFLMNSQFEDGSWHVSTRAIPIQPFFESDFPWGHDQWISAAATGFATTALAASSGKH